MPAKEIESAMSDAISKLSTLVSRRAKEPLPNAAQREKEKAEKEALRIIKLLKSWRLKDSWRLREEACALALGFDPPMVDDLTIISSEGTLRQKLFEIASSSVEAGLLAVLNPDAPPRDRRVRPEHFARWLEEKSAGGLDCKAVAFMAVFPKKQAKVEAGAVAADLAERLTPEIEAALAVIKHFWWDKTLAKKNAPSAKIVKPWIAKNCPGLTPNQVAAVDRIARPVKYRGGGNNSRKR